MLADLVTPDSAVARDCYGRRQTWRRGARVGFRAEAGPRIGTLVAIDHARPWGDILLIQSAGAVVSEWPHRCWIATNDNQTTTP